MFLYAIKPWIVLLRTGELTTSYEVTYPFDINNLPMFIFLYVEQLFVACNVVVSYSSESLFGAFVNITCLRFDVLIENFKIKINNMEESNARQNLLRGNIIYQNEIYK